MACGITVAPSMAAISGQAPWSGTCGISPARVAIGSGGRNQSAPRKPATITASTRPDAQLEATLAVAAQQAQQDHRDQAHDDPTQPQWDPEQ